MKYIVKKHPPKTLQDYVNETPNPSYEGCPCKGGWKKSLLEEQGYICAYTMQRITEANMKIEHFLPRKEYPKLALDYNNTLAVCNGNEGAPFEQQYADTRKGNRLLTQIDPRQKDCERKIKYRRNGEIRIDDSSLANELIDNNSNRSILNLNHDELVDGRYAAFQGVIKTIGRPERAWRRIDVEDMMEKYSDRDNEGKFEKYCMFVVYRLNHRLKKMR